MPSPTSFSKSSARLSLMRTMVAVALLAGLLVIPPFHAHAARSTAIAIISGTAQQALVGTPFETPFSVAITDGEGNALSGIAVTFIAPKGGASGTFGRSGTTAHVISDAKGIATAPLFSANQIDGSYRLIVEISGDGWASANTIALTNRPFQTYLPLLQQ